MPKNWEISSLLPGGQPTIRALLVAIAAILTAATSANSSNEPGMTLVCFGDSITGYRPGEPYHHSHLKYCDLLGLAIEARNGIGSVRTINAGYAGDRTFPSGGHPGAINRLQTEVLDIQPDIAVILIGGNDRDRDREATAANLNQIFAACQGAGIQTLALQYHVLADDENPGDAWVDLDDNNDLIAAAAEANGVELLDMDPPMEAAAAGADIATLVDTRDRVHLAPGGEIVYARTIYARLAELGWLDRTVPW